MKLTIERAALLKSLGHVQSVVERRNTIPILSNVLIEAGQGAAKLTATDMDLTIVEEVGCQVAEAGATTAPAHTLYDIVRKLPDGAQVELDVHGDQGQMRLKSGRSTFQLATLPKEDFPATQANDLPQAFSLQGKELRELIDRTRFAISTEETRYYLNGIYVHATSDEAKMLRGVATDGHRLARFEMPLPDGAEGMPGVIVPRKTVNELRKLIDETDGGVEVALSETKVRFTFDHTVLTSKLIDGTFPDYERVIPSGNDKMMEVDRKAFASAVDRVSTISTEKSRAVKLSLADNTLTLSATSPENGSATEELEISYQGETIEIGFNSRYLLDIAERLSGDGAQFSLSDSASPTIVQDAGDTSALYVLMPMRV
jgi:DNA polymerase-3 subunit beta